MAGIFDSHTHLNDELYKKKEMFVEDIVSDAKKYGVDRMCCVGFDVKSSKKATMYASRFPGVYAAVGIHPTEAHKVFDIDIEDINTLANADKVVAVGEIGLDYYYDDSHKDIQKQIFERQIDIALKYGKVVMMHIRDKDGSHEAYKDALKILLAKKVKRAIVHCFNQNYECAKMFTDHGFYISIPGVITYKNAVDLQEAVKKISINLLLVETDAPYLTPEPNRGKINEPKFIKQTVEKIAKLKNMELDDVITSTTNNALKIFNIK